MGRARVPEAKEVQDTTICWQGDSHSILGRKRRYHVGFFIQEKYSNWSVLCKVAINVVEGNGYNLIPYPANSPDLAPSDFFVFSNLKKKYPWMSFWV